MKENVHPLDIVFRLAEDHGIVLLNGSGFDAPDWSVRVSFANLDDHVYDDIGRAVRAIARGYRQAYEAATGKSAGSARGKEEESEEAGVTICERNGPCTSPYRNGGAIRDGSSRSRWRSQSSPADRRRSRRSLSSHPANGGSSRAPGTPPAPAAPFPSARIARARSST